MESSQLGQYYDNILDQLEKNIQGLDAVVMEKSLEELFTIKPVRLKWYLVKAQLMLKQGEEIDKIIDFLSDKCEAWYAYEGVEEWFQLLSVLLEMKGDHVESQRYQYQFNKLLETLYGMVGRNAEMDEKLGALTSEMENKKDIQKDDILMLEELYYVRGDIYLYLLWHTVADRMYGVKEEPVREWVLQKANMGYYYERLLNNQAETFAIIMDTEKEAADCRLAGRALLLLGKKVFLLKPAVLWEKGNDIQEVVLANIDSIKKESNGLIDIYEIESENNTDTRIAVLDYIAQNYSKEDLITVLGNGFLMDSIAVEKKSQPRFERLTTADADYMEGNMAVGRYGDYLAYVANIYRTSKQEVREELYKKPSCRFSIIIPCRNVSETLYYTLKTCLNQNFQGDYEIIVSDNSDMYMGTDTRVHKICWEFHDDRIKYYRTPRDLPLTKSFEWAYLKARGEFVLAMGADDGILPWALEELDQIISKRPDLPILLWNEAHYVWGNLAERRGGKAELVVKEGYKRKTEILKYSSQEVLLKSFDEYGMMYYLPQLYHNAGIHREYLANIYEKTGVLWAGISQDICMAVTIANLEEIIYFADNILTIEALSANSIGVQCIQGKSDLQGLEISRKMIDTYAQGWHIPGWMERLCPSVGGTMNGLYMCILYAYSIGIIPDDVINGIDWKILYQQSIAEINLEDIYFDKKLHRLRYAASLHGEEMLGWFDDTIYDKFILPKYINNNTGQKKREEAVCEENIIIGDEKVEVASGSIADVYAVSLFLEKYYKGKTGKG